MNISVVGLGKLGAVMAAVFADSGHDITGVDVNPNSVDAVNEGRAPVQEPGLDEMIAANRARLRGTLDMAEAVLSSEATFVIVPTPSGEDGRFSLRYVEPAIVKIGKALARKNSYHLVVLSSTVMPGATEKIRQMLEQTSGKRCGEEFGFCYNPEFIALGSVIRDMLNPEMLLIGESDERAGQMLAGIYGNVCKSKPVVARMNFVNAELTKLSVNTYVTTKISYANMLAEICEKLPGADADVVTSALGLDSRIGRKYLKGALGYGGPCFPRDNVAFAALARSLGIEAILAEATHRVNSLQVPRLASLTMSLLSQGASVGVLGLSYKPETSVVEESQGLQLAAQLAGSGVSVTVYDPLAMDNARAVLGDAVHYAGSMIECASRGQVVVVTTPWSEFKQLRPDGLSTAHGPAAVIDCWRIMDRAAFESKVTYVTLGAGMSTARMAMA